ncbi:hypothetical protein CPB97_010856 [Podila verticillata]|nr:hypothetical protein CPB97_010856 [Podila verticillata]
METLNEQELEQFRELLIQQLANLELNAEPNDSDADSDMDAPFDMILDSDTDIQDVEDFDDVYHWPEGAPGPQTVAQISNAQENDCLPEDGALSSALDDLSLDQEQNDGQDSEQEQNPAEAAAGEKKKKKRKNKKKKNMPRVEDFVEEAEDAEFVYDTSTSADSRFRTAMERFRKNRIFSPMSSQILAKYFSYGGMDDHGDVTPKFVAPKYSVSAATKEGPPELDIQVDFMYVVSAFLSSFILKRAGWTDQVYFDLAPRIVAAFLRYLLAKRVVPEYQDQIEEALVVAVKAHSETPRCNEFNQRMPDVFHLSCSILFTKEYALDDLPDESLEVLEQVAILKSPKDAKVESFRFVWAKVVEQELPKRVLTTSTEIIAEGELEASESLESNTGTSDIDIILPKFVKVQLKECMPNGSEKPLHPNTDRNLLYLNMEADIAALLEPGMVIHGKFYQLSTRLLFARPIVAFPTFHVEEDEDGLHTVREW